VTSDLCNADDLRVQQTIAARPSSKGCVTGPASPLVRSNVARRDLDSISPSSPISGTGTANGNIDQGVYTPSSPSDRDEVNGRAGSREITSPVAGASGQARPNGLEARHMPFVLGCRNDRNRQLRKLYRSLNPRTQQRNAAIGAIYATTSDDTQGTSAVAS